MAMAKIKKGDTVVLLVGPKEQRGRTGEVLKVLPKENKVVVSGLKLAKRHRKPTQQNPEGGIDTFEAPIHISNVALADPKTGKATRVKIATDKDGKKSRVAVKSGEKISG